MREIEEVLPLSDSYDDAFDNKKFSSDILKKAITEALTSLGPTWRDMIFEDMAKSGINLDSEARYSINDIRKYVYAIFEQEMGEVVLDKVRKQLRKTP